MDNRENDRASVWMLVSSMLIFGTIGIFRKYIPLSSPLLAFSRGILGGLFLLAFTKLRRGNGNQPLPTATFLRLILTGALIGINWMLLFEAYNHTTVAVATLCYYMQPTIVMLLSPVLFGEKLTAKKSLCALAAIAGMVLICGITGGGDLRPQNLQGILFGLGAAVFYSAVVILNKRISGIDAYQKTTIQLFSAGIVMIPYLLITGGFRSEGAAGSALLLLLFVGIVHTGIAYVLYFKSMDGLKAQSIALLSYIDPASALLFSAVFLKEPLSVTGLIGAVMIIGSAAVSELQKD